MTGLKNTPQKKDAFLADFCGFQPVGTHAKNTKIAHKMYSAIRFFVIHNTGINN
jgi:hypothetical protein